MVSAKVDAAGRFVGGDRAAFARLGLDPDADRLRVPAHDRISWEPTEAGGLCRIVPTSDGQWDVGIFASGEGRATRSALNPENLAAFVRSTDFGSTITNLSSSFAAASGMTVPIVVLIDASGDPTFAGGTTQDYRQLEAMERCRRASAPMAIWQAFEEQRLTVDTGWIETVRTDDRFIAIRNLLPAPSAGDDLVYVAIPLRNDRTVIGIVAAFWPKGKAITADQVDLWLLLADEVAQGIQFSELLRRAQVNGAEAERVRINDDIHAGLAQSIFALSLEIARVSAGRSLPETADLQALQRMADDLSADVRGFLSDGRVDSGGTNLVSRLQELASEISTQTSASVLADHRVDWGEYSYDFADYVVRIVTEAFRNITKHSNATNISFRSWIDADSTDVVIEIADDGRNEPRQPAQSAGVGLALISELTARWRGSVEFEATSTGATLTIRVMPEYQSEWAVAQRILQAGTDVG